MNRNAKYAGSFYPASQNECESMFRTFPEKLATESCAGIVPHAGWVYSGYTAYSVCKALRAAPTFVIFGAIHVPGVYSACTWSGNSWNTPFGKVEIDEELLPEIISSGLVEINNKAHTSEHSIEVVLPFISYFFPKSKFVPIMIPAQESAAEIGRVIAEIDADVVVIGSTDLTHYGTRFGFTPKGVGQASLDWVKKENDKRIIDLMLSLEHDKIIKEVRQNQNACGAGAIAATLSFAKEKGKSTGQLLHYTTSWDVHPQGPVDNFVGYSGIVF